MLMLKEVWAPELQHSFNVSPVGRRKRKIKRKKRRKRGERGYRGIRKKKGRKCLLLELKVLADL